MKVQKLERTRLSFMEKMTSKDPKTLRSYNVTINNFENSCMEKYGKADFVSDLKDLINRIRIQIMLGFNQLQAILGSLEQNVTEELLKKLEDWVGYMGELNKRSIETIGTPQKTNENNKLKKPLLTKSLQKESEEPMLDFLDKIRLYQNINKNDLDEAVRKLSK